MPSPTEHTAVSNQDDYSKQHLLARHRERITLLTKRYGQSILDGLPPYRREIFTP